MDDGIDNASASVGTTTDVAPVRQSTQMGVVALALIGVATALLSGRGLASLSLGRLVAAAGFSGWAAPPRMRVT